MKTMGFHSLFTFFGGNPAKCISAVNFENLQGDLDAALDDLNLLGEWCAVPSQIAKR